ncbi:heat-shock protein 15 [Betaproteobacteria bacterium]|nr:heat-shock protein 15 [Betaproteobacteria bacterium]
MTETLRIDKWLWAARFFKTRSLATAAIHAGHVRWNGEIPKPARDLRIGDTLDIALGPMRWTVIVRALNDQRRPADEAQQLYEETSESRARRETVKENLRIAPMPGSGLKGRPTKKDRRQIHRFNESY